MAMNTLESLARAALPILLDRMATTPKEHRAKGGAKAGDTWGVEINGSEIDLVTLGLCMGVLCKIIPSGIRLSAVPGCFTGDTESYLHVKNEVGIRAGKIANAGRHTSHYIQVGAA